MFFLALPLGIIMVAMPFLWNGVDYYNTTKKCIGANVQVGDTVQTRNGDLLVVEEVDGPSILCKDPELPIKATLTKEK